MDDRKLQVLRAIVSDYVSSQEPVGSKALVERHDLGVSPATVRNDMAALEGGLHHPAHTSAGRIPRQGLPAVRGSARSIKPLSPAEQRAIQTFCPAHRPRRRPARTVRLLRGHLSAGGHRAVSDDQPLHGSPRRGVAPPAPGAVDPDHLDGRIEQRALDLPGHEEGDLAELRAHLNTAPSGTRRRSRGPAQPTGRRALPDLDRFGRACIATLLEMLEQRDLQSRRGRRHAQSDPVRRRVRDHRTAGAGGPRGTGGAADPARGGPPRATRCWSGSARRIRTRTAVDVGRGQWLRHPG